MGITLVSTQKHRGGGCHISSVVNRDTRRMKKQEIMTLPMAHKYSEETDPKAMKIYEVLEKMKIMILMDMGRCKRTQMRTAITNQSTYKIIKSN